MKEFKVTVPNETGPKTLLIKAICISINSENTLVFYDEGIKKAFASGQWLTVEEVTEVKEHEFSLGLVNAAEMS